MLGQHYREKPSNHWINQEERDPGFNGLSPMGRHRPFKGTRLPRPAIPRHGSTVGQGYFGVNVSNNADGVPYVYTKGPAGQTPFPTLVAMSDKEGHKATRLQDNITSSTSPHSFVTTAHCLAIAALFYIVPIRVSKTHESVLAPPFHVCHLSLCLLSDDLKSSAQHLEEDAKAAYERLIDTSRLPMDRRRTLQAAYQLFLRNKLQSFWPDHLLKMEKQVTKTKFMIAVTKSARVVQKASAKEIANTAKSLEDDGDHQDESVCALKSNHKPEAGNKRSHAGSVTGSDASPTQTAQSAQVGQKRSRDHSDDGNPAPRKSHRNRLFTLSMPASSAGSVVDQEDQFDAEDVEDEVEDDVVFVPSPKLSTRSSSFGKATAPSTSFKSFAPSQKWSAPSAQHAQPSPSASAGPPSAMPIKFSKTPPALRHRTLESPSGIRDKAGQALTKKPEVTYLFAGDLFWKLTSGTCVEAVLFKRTLFMNCTMKIRSFMIDNECPMTESLFEPKDWLEIKGSAEFAATSTIYPRISESYQGGSNYRNPGN
ncbi:MAG: hypothetical protein J3Q66DRAFT_411338 [Benniella sp.]|nr:MAG: hypothetical protein J3Q66DRAFT_411338 [Benniella sp.]